MMRSKNVSQPNQNLICSAVSLTVVFYSEIIICQVMQTPILFYKYNGPGPEKTRLWGLRMTKVGEYGPEIPELHTADQPHGTVRKNYRTFTLTRHP